MAQINAYSQPSVSIDSQQRIGNTASDPSSTDSEDAKPRDLQGWLKIYWKRSEYKWTHTVQPMLFKGQLYNVVNIINN